MTTHREGPPDRSTDLQAALAADASPHRGWLFGLGGQHNDGDPFTGTIGNWTITIEDRAPRHGEHVQADWQIVTPGYLETMGIRLAQGRSLTEADAGGARLVAVINETMARRYWPGEEAIGKRFHLGTLDQPWVEIVGLTRDVRQNAMVEDARAEMYLLHTQWVRAKNGVSPQFGMTVVVLTAGDFMALLPQLREQVRGVDVSLAAGGTRVFAPWLWYSRRHSLWTARSGAGAQRTGPIGAIPWADNIILREG